jgi:uncharacterized protein (DUF433 family)
MRAAAAERTMKSPRVISDPEILGGTPVFVGTRVPVRILFEHLEAGDPLEVFLEDFPSVSRELAVQVLEDAKSHLEADAHTA